MAVACRISRPLAAGCPRSKMRIRRELQFARFDGDSVPTCPAAVCTRRGSRAAELASRAVSPMAARIRRMGHELGDLFHSFRHGAGIDDGGGFPCHTGGVLRAAGRATALRHCDRMGHSRFRCGQKFGTEHGAAAQRERRTVATWRRIGTQPRCRTSSDVSGCSLRRIGRQWTRIPPFERGRLGGVERLRPRSSS